MKISKLSNQLHSSWKKSLKDEFSKDYFLELESFLESEVKGKKDIFPVKKDVFSAFEHTSLKDVKVVIIGQDPYHGEGQAHGMCFSVRAGVKVPPSLRNIYKELNDDVDFEIPTHGFLEPWADQGVLLLNSILTVEKSLAGSHHKKGWEIFTDKVIEILNNKKEGLVFILWGAPAQKKAKKVDDSKHFILKSPHPSPLSSYRGFFGCKHFSKCNEYLNSNGHKEINWQLPIKI